MQNKHKKDYFESNYAKFSNRLQGGIIFLLFAAVAAGPIYKMLGKKDLGTETFPPVGTALTDGEVSFRQHNGGHTPGPNWPVFLQLAERYFDKLK